MTEARYQVCSESAHDRPLFALRMASNTQHRRGSAEQAAVFESRLAGFAVVREGRFASVNDEFARIAGSTPAKLEGARADAFAPIEGHPTTPAGAGSRPRG